ncbi:cysteine hydrolase family protein [Eggerthella guodeyinii]|uniref:Isochorismatase family protein n=1 Tax=Eggerthella guodeyinii TaxID=2690837 RepID=A0A6N7RQB6_9ACTN|nr:cysteine hydrolase family protein [Eggerthella guodeyinii]MRX83469.1 isochorismatase family protein [Eggerthella guodeyinii]
MQNGAYDALIVIDVQTALVEAHPSDEERFIASVGALIEACRCNGVPVVYVLHDGGAGDELERGTDGWQAYAAVAPQGGEPCVSKRFNSAFRRTGLHEMLRSLGAKRLVMCGMQTEFCFDASVKVAFELGFEVTVPREAVTTFDSEFATGDALTAYFEDRIWDGRFAQVKDTASVIEELAAR